MAAPTLRPLGLGEILDVSLKLAWRNFGTLARIVLCVVAPAQLLIAVVDVSALPGYRGPYGFSTTPTQTTIDVHQLWTRAAAALVALVIGFLASSLATGAAFRAIAEIYLGFGANWRASLSFAGRKLHSILWIAILSFVLDAVGALFCILPGVYLYVSFAVAFPVLMSEGQRGSKALGRSRALVRGRWWWTLLFLIVAGLLTWVLTALITGLIDALNFAGNPDTVELLVITAVGGTAAALVTTPFSAAYHTVLYFDLRVRKEAFDLRLLANRIGVAPPEGWEPPPPTGPPAGERPPYWPPPPGWQPSPGAAAPGGPAIWPPLGPTPPAEPAEGEPPSPPFWPPPPGWPS